MIQPTKQVLSLYRRDDSGMGFLQLERSDMLEDFSEVISDFKETGIVTYTRSDTHDIVSINSEIAQVAIWNLDTLITYKKDV